MRVIVNADDLGRNVETNRSVIELARSGRITSVSLIANGPAVREAITELEQCPNISKGIHLNLTEFAPLTSWGSLGPLRKCLDEKGEFRGEECLRSMPVTAALSQAIFAEWVLQVKALLSMGVKLSHFDSHNHVHNLPSLFPVLKRLQRHFGIRKVRATWNIFPPSKKPGWGSVMKKRIWHLALRHYYPTITTDGFTSLADFIRVASSGPLPFESVELMVHPGHPDFTEETELLRTDWQKMIPLSTELISYEAL